MTDTEREWDDRYAKAARAASSVWSPDPNPWVQHAVGDLIPGTAIDLGCGEGRHALWLASLGWRVTAVDFSASGLDTGRARARQAGLNIDWVHADATVWKSPTPVDLIVVAYLQLGRHSFASAIANSVAALAPGGTLAVIGHDRDNLEHGVGGPQNPDLLYTVGDLRRETSRLVLEQLQQHLRIVEGADRPAIDTVLLGRRAK